MASPATYLGDFTAERTVLLSSLAPDAENGEFIRTLCILADPLRGDPSNYWVLTLGRFASSDFQPVRSLPFPQGFPEGAFRVSLDPEIPVSRGDLFAIRATPTGGSTSPLTGLSVVAEYARSGARAR
jgi:hypothetical protein